MSPAHLRPASLAFAVFFCLAAPALSSRMAAQSTGPTGPMPYAVVEGWADPFQEPGFAWGGNSGIHVASPDRIIVLQRGETRLPQPVPPEFTGYAGSIGLNVLRGERRVWQNVIYEMDGDGEVIAVWSQWDHLFEGTDGPGPHRLRVSPYDPARRVWVVHETGHQIFVFSNDGRELLLTLGEKNVPGTDATHFGKPQDVAFLPDGRALVADGYDNGRVVVIDADDGRYLSEFGTRGEALGRFNVVHGLAIGPDGMVLVADRDNRRVQLFRQSAVPAGSYHPEFVPEAEWTGFNLALDLIVSGESVWLSDVGPPRISRLDFEGRVVDQWRLPNEGPTAFLEAHSITVDQEGALFATDNQHGRTQKLVPRPDADPARLVGQPYVRPTVHSEPAAPGVDALRDRRIVLVTGSTSGLGREVALALGEEGAHVIVHGRNAERGREVVEQIEAGPGSAVFFRADLASLDEVRMLAEAVRRDYDRLDVLVNNAGIWLSGDDERRTSADGYELSFAVNYLSQFLLTHLLVPIVPESPSSRIVQVSSIAQTPIDFDDPMMERGYSGGRGYGQSKLAQILFTFDLAEELEGTGIGVHALHPATLMDTNMVRSAGVRPRTSVEEGLEAVLHLVNGQGLGSGRYFNGLEPARAHDQAYDRAARDRLRRLSEELIGR